jgi:hypothetical protein
MISIVSHGRFSTGISFAGRTLANKSNTFRSVTLALLCPVPIGVVVGPFSATLFLAMFLMVLSGSKVPYFSKQPNPISSYSHLISTPLASITCRTASQISGQYLLPEASSRHVVPSVNLPYAARMTGPSAPPLAHSRLAKAIPAHRPSRPAGVGSHFRHIVRNSRNGFLALRAVPIQAVHTHTRAACAVHLCSLQTGGAEDRSDGCPVTSAVNDVARGRQ